MFRGALNVELRGESVVAVIGIGIALLLAASSLLGLLALSHPSAAPLDSSSARTLLVLLVEGLLSIYLLAGALGELARRSWARSHLATALQIVGFLTVLTTLLTVPGSMGLIQREPSLTVAAVLFTLLLNGALAWALFLAANFLRRNK